MLYPPGDAKSEEKPMVVPRANSNFPAFESLVASKCNQGTLSYSIKASCYFEEGRLRHLRAFYKQNTPTRAVRRKTNTLNFFQLRAALLFPLENYSCCVFQSIGILGIDDQSHISSHSPFNDQNLA